MGKKIVAILCLVMLVSSCGIKVPAGYRPSDQAVPTVNVTEIAIADRKSPIEISGTALEGKELSTATYQGVTVVNAWASWCAPCRDEWPILVSVRAAYPTVNFLGLNEADDLAAARQFVADMGGNWEHIQDKDNSIALKKGVIEGNFLPGTIVLDSQHRIAAKFVGPVTESGLKQIVEKLLAE